MGDASGQLWKEQRRFAVHHMFGHQIIKLRSVEPIVDHEATKLIKQMRKRSLLGPINIHLLLARPIERMIGAVAHGARFGYEDKKFESLELALNLISQLFKAVAIQTLFPSLKPLLRLFYYSQFQQLRACFDRVDKYHEMEIMYHSKTINYNEPPRDYIDAYLIALNNKAANNEKNSFSSEFRFWSD